MRDAIQHAGPLAPASLHAAFTALSVTIVADVGDLPMVRLMQPEPQDQRVAHHESNTDLFRAIA
eukprot:8332805-Prorocentrum_lima.AAC.1